MRLVRYFLLATGLLSLIFGVAYLIAPQLMSEAMGFTPPPDALTDIRATYGGLQMGLGAFLLWTARSALWHRPGLILLCLLFPAVAASRAIGMLVDEGPTAVALAALAFEIGMSLAAWYVLSKLPSSGEPAA